MEESRESLFSSSANDADISDSSVDLLLMDWMDFSSTWPPPLLLLGLVVPSKLVRDIGRRQSFQQHTAEMAALALQPFPLEAEIKGRQ